MKILSFTGEKVTTQEKSAELFRFQRHSYTWGLHNLWTYDVIYAHLSDKISVAALQVILHLP